MGQARVIIRLAVTSQSAGGVHPRTRIEAGDRQTRQID